MSHCIDNANQGASTIFLKKSPRPALNHLIRRVVKQGFDSLKQSYEIRRQHKINRDAYARLLTLDDSRLKDIGVSRDDVIWGRSTTAVQQCGAGAGYQGTSRQIVIEQILLG